MGLYVLFVGYSEPIRYVSSKVESPMYVFGDIVGLNGKGDGEGDRAASRTSEYPLGFVSVWGHSS